MVLQGQVKIQMRINLNGKEQVREFANIEANRDFGKIEAYDYRKRIQTTISLDTSHLIVIEKRPYSDLLRQLHRDQLEKLINMLKCFQVFQSFSRSNLLSMLPFFVYRTYDKRQEVYREGDFCEEIYFILDGQFKSFKCSSSVKQLQPEYQEVKSKLTKNRPKAGICEA